MSGVFDVAAYFPERPPTWSEVVLTLLAVGTISGRLLTDSVSVPLAVAGFLLFALALGPGSASGPGQRADQWFRDIGKRGRGSVIVLFSPLSPCCQCSPERSCWCSRTLHSV